MKKFLILLSVFLLTFGLFCTSAQAADNIQITVDGKNVTFTDAKPYMDSNNRVMVPMRTLGEALGCKVDYIASQSIYDANIGYYQSNPEIILTKYTKSGLKAVSCYDPNNETPSCFYIENHHMYYIYLDTDIAGKQSRTYLPARHVAENFGYNVTWDNNTQTVVVTTNKDNILFNHTNNTVSKKDLYGKWVKTNYAGSVYGYVEFTENTYTTSGVDYSKNSYINTKSYNITSIYKNIIDFETEAWDIPNSFWSVATPIFADNPTFIKCDNDTAILINHIPYSDMTNSYILKKYEY